MFTWICPTCGREVPPSYAECPDCAAKAKAGAAAPGADSAPASPPATAVAAAPPAPNSIQVPPPRPPQAAVPTWLLAVLFALAFAAVGGGIYWLVHYFGSRTQASVTAPTPDAPPVLPAGAKESAIQKYIEVSGIRFQESPKDATLARFLVINHSGADITDLAATVQIWARAGKTEEADGTFSFKLPSLGPYESKEAVAAVTTKLKVYELPDWQFINTQVRVTSP